MQKCADVIDSDSVNKFNIASIVTIDQIDRNVRLGPDGLRDAIGSIIGF